MRFFAVLGAVVHSQPTAAAVTDPMSTFGRYGRRTSESGGERSGLGPCQITTTTRILQLWVSRCLSARAKAYSWAAREG